MVNIHKQEKRIVSICHQSHKSYFSAQYKSGFLFNLLKLIENAIKENQQKTGSFIHQIDILPRSLSLQIRNPSELTPINSNKNSINLMMHELLAIK